MTSRIAFYLTPVALTSVLAFTWPQSSRSDPGARSHHPPAATGITVQTAAKKISINVELATTRGQRHQGLKGRQRLAPDAGMLFVFEEPKVTSMWMVDTLIPLDMLFIDPEGVIIRITENTTPLSDTPILSGKPVKAVLEVNGGTARRFGIEPGDRVIHPAIGESCLP